MMFGTQTCGSIDEGTEREWLVADGCGGYAMGTVAGLRTRRYHGLLVVSGETPAARHVALAALDPIVELPSGNRVNLGTHEWSSGSISPDGYRYLESFELVDGLPRWRYRIGEVVLERELAMTYGSPAVGIVHRLLAGPAVTVRLSALCTWRDAHGERYAGGGDLLTETIAGGVEIEKSYRLAGPGWQPAGGWYLGAYLREEKVRGLSPVEDLWHAGDFTALLVHQGDAIEVTAWAGDSPPPPAPIVIHQARHRAVEIGGTSGDECEATLRRAADSFIVKGPDVVAGYPWFGAWSRDTMISFPGLFLSTGRFEEGAALLRRYAGTLSEGMLANTADTGQVEYNTVDGTLWFVQAIAGYLAATGDKDLGVELRPAVEAIRDAHEAGTRYGIRVDPGDWLLSAGAPGYALTWMDARVNGVAITPRIGKPVEVNALWINALRVLADLRQAAGVDAQPIVSQAERAGNAFRQKYPAPTGWLYDVLDPADSSLRPNQLIAYSLPHGPMRGEPVPAAVGDLVTTLGLRSLARYEPAYLGRHQGGPVDRDTAYHQGTVWPWLIGPYVSARRAAGQPVAGVTDGLVAHLHDYGLGSVSETTDGDEPHGATGCPFQAWSVGELLRVYRDESAAT
jgi:predicted glycogen debranching enzyme